MGTVSESGGRYVVIGDTRLFVAARGQGYPVVLVHGGKRSPIRREATGEQTGTRVRPNSMTRGWFLAEAVLGVGLAVLAQHTVPAAACSIAPSTLQSNADHAQLIIVGQVVAERPLSPSLAAGYEAYESTIHVAAILKGDATSQLTLGPLGFLGPDCSGGPRLQVGERVLLFLSSPQRLQPGSAPQVFGYEGGKYLLTNGTATSQYAEPRTMPADQALRQVASITGVPTVQLDAALAFARGEEPTPEAINQEPVFPATGAGGGLSPFVIGLVATGGATVVALSLLAMRRLLRRRKQ